MKKNWIAVVSLLLQVVTLALVVLLGVELRETEQALRNRMADTENQLRSDISESMWSLKRIVEDSTLLVEEFSMETVDIDAEKRTLESKTELRLRRWSGDTAAAVEITADGERYLQTLNVDTDGVCRGNILLPLSAEGEISLAAVITTGGITAREELEGWSNFYRMLPIAFVGGGWGTPDWRSGVLTGYSFHASPRNIRSEGVEVTDPCFRIYHNGEAVQEFVGTPVTDSRLLSYEPVMEKNGWSVPCEKRDTVEIRFSGKDAFGLSYDFYLTGWTIGMDGETKDYEPEGSIDPVLLWD